MEYKVRDVGGEEAGAASSEPAGSEELEEVHAETVEAS